MVARMGSALLALVVLFAGGFVVTPVAHAAPWVTGQERWNDLPAYWETWNLKKDGVGYALELTPTRKAGKYRGTVIFQYQNGSIEDVAKLSLSVDRYSRVRIKWQDGKRSRGTLSLRSEGYPDTLLELDPGCFPYFKNLKTSRANCWFYPVTNGPMSPGTIGLADAARSLRTAIVQDLGRGDPRCYSVQVPVSSRKWGLMQASRYAVKNARQCNPSDSTTVITKRKGRWEATNVSGSVFGCSTFKAGGSLSRLGASAAVLRDFSHHFKDYCDPSY